MSCGELTGDLKTNREGGLTKHVGVRKRFIPKLFVWHSSRDIVRMKWRCNRTGLYTEKKRSHWLKQWPIRKGLGDKKRRVANGWNIVET